MSLWVFGYGSIIWRPEIPYTASYRATAVDWSRRFWQGSHDHRGTPDSPGRVLTLVQMAGQRCEGRVFNVPDSDITATLSQLDYREKNGYERQQIRVETADVGTVEALTYIAPEHNEAWLGDAPSQVIADHIQKSSGQSGSNTDYVLSLYGALLADNINDPHIAEIAGLLQGPRHTSEH